MPMVPFYTRFPQVAMEETRAFTLLESQQGIPEGQYGFLELYCDEPGCDCRRVLIQVASPPPDSRTLASINYGWEDEAFYHTWGSSGPETGQGPFLDPLNPQSVHAPAMLRLFCELALSDESYVRRLARHYEMFKAGASRPLQGGNARARRAQLRRLRRKK